VPEAGTHHGRRGDQDGQARHGTSPSFGGQWLSGALALAALGYTQRRRFARVLKYL